MRAFTVSETALRLHPVERDPFIAPPAGDRTCPPRPAAASGHPMLTIRHATLAR
jgi:hypothetical protein